MSHSHTVTEYGEIVSLGAHQIRVTGHLELLAVEGGFRPIRLPARYWNQFPPRGAHVRATFSRPSGVRLLIHTDGTRITLTARCTRLKVAERFAEENSFVAVVAGNEVAVVVTPTDAVEETSLIGEDIRTVHLRDSSRLEFADLPAGNKIVEIWLPQMMMIDLLDIEGDGRIEPGNPPAWPVWVHYGSSISHGGEPAKPTQTWPVVSARQAKLNLINLGVAGQCMIDPFVADAIASTPADVISLKVGINVVGARAMDQRTFIPAVHGFLDRVRSGHPDTPIVLVSPLLWPGSDDVAGPTGLVDLPDGTSRFRAIGTKADVQAGALSLQVARDHLRHVARKRSEQGEAISYLDGLRLYGEADADRYPMPDGLHPDAILYEEIGRRFAQLVFGADGLRPHLR